MSEDRTQDQNGKRPFEERVLSMLTEMRKDFNARLEKLEAKSYDTRPVWERALKEIADLRAEMNERFDDVEGKIDVLSRDMLQLRSDQVRLHRRVDDLEAPRA